MDPTTSLPLVRDTKPWEIYLGVSVGCLMASWITVASYGWALFASPILVLIVLFPCLLIFLVRFFMKKTTRHVVSGKNKIRVFLIFLLIVWPICVFLPLQCYWIPLRVQLWSVPVYTKWEKTKSEIVLFGYDSQRSCQATLTGYSNPKACLRYYEEWLKSKGYVRNITNEPKDFRTPGDGGKQFQIRYYSKNGKGTSSLVLCSPIIYDGDPSSKAKLDTQRASQLKIHFGYE